MFDIGSAGCPTPLDTLRIKRPGGSVSFCVALSSVTPSVGQLSLLPSAEQPAFPAGSSPSLCWATSPAASTGTQLMKENAAFNIINSWKMDGCKEG